MDWSAILRTWGKIKKLISYTIKQVCWWKATTKTLKTAKYCCAFSKSTECGACGWETTLYKSPKRNLCCKQKASVLLNLYKTEILRRVNKELGHKMHKKGSEWILERFRWREMHDSVVKHIAICVNGQQANVPASLNWFFFYSTKSNLFNKFFVSERLGVVPANKAKTTILVRIDHFSGFSYIAPCINDTALKACMWMTVNWFWPGRSPAHVLSGNGLESFVEIGQFFLFANFGTRVFSTQENPWMNGLSGQQNPMLPNFFGQSHPPNVMTGMNSSRKSLEVIIFVNAIQVVTLCHLPNGDQKTTLAENK